MGLRALFSQPEPVFISAAARGCSVPALSPGGGSSLLLGTMSPDFCISSPSPAPQNPWGSQLRDVPVGTELLPLPYQGAKHQHRRFPLFSRPCWGLMGLLASLQVQWATRRLASRTVAQWPQREVLSTHGLSRLRRIHTELHGCQEGGREEVAPLGFEPL